MYIKSIGFNVQETILGEYRLENNKTKIVCACKDFTTDGFILKEFAELKNSIIDSPNNGYGTDLNEVLNTMESQNLYSAEELKRFFWNMFIVDALLGNFDRHNGNWGFLINRETKEVRIAPVFDCGSCLYPQLDDITMEKYLKDRAEIEKRVYVFPNSALKIDDKKINYYEFIKSGEFLDCNKALINIYPNINLEEINNIIENTSGISDIRKDFYKIMIKERYENILTPPYKRLNKINIENNEVESEDDEEFEE